MPVESFACNLTMCEVIRRKLCVLCPFDSLSIPPAAVLQIIFLKLFTRKTVGEQKHKGRL